MLVLEASRCNASRFKCSFKTHISSAQFQHAHFKCSFNTHISGAVSTRTFQVQFQHTHFKCSFNTHISSAVSTHRFPVQFQHTHFRCSFYIHISSTVSKTLIVPRNWIVPKKTFNCAGLRNLLNFKVCINSTKPILGSVKINKSYMKLQVNWWNSICTVL